MLTDVLQYLASAGLILIGIICILGIILFIPYVAMALLLMTH